jgi:hypothetical protein
VGQKIDLIFLLDQALLHCLATPAEHRLGAPRTSAADLCGDLRLKRSSVRASQPTAELLDGVFALLQKFSPHQTPPCRGAISGVRHSLAKVDSGTNFGRLQTCPTNAGRLQTCPTNAGRLKTCPTNAGRVQTCPANLETTLH